MKSEDVQKLAVSAFDRLAEALEAGRSSDLRAFLSAAARFHSYSFRNLLLIASQLPDASRVAGFQTWKSLGRYVKKGEHGIVIIAPMVGRKREAAERPNSSEDERSIYGFRAAYVFDVAQTDGEPLPDLERATGEPGAKLDAMKALVQSRSITLEYADELSGADGESRKGTIVLRRGLAPAEEFSVLVHELAHELLHQGERRSETTRDVRELEAEAVACIVSEAIGLATVQASSDYIQLYRGDRERLRESLEMIQRTAIAILDGLATD